MLLRTFVVESTILKSLKSFPFSKVDAAPIVRSNRISYWNGVHGERHRLSLAGFGAATVMSKIVAALVPT